MIKFFFNELLAPGRNIIYFKLKLFTSVDEMIIRNGKETNTKNIKCNEIE